jgi:hypothetical protein
MLSPWSDMSEKLDMRTAHGRKTYEAGIDPLTPKFDGTLKALRPFLQRLEDRADTCGWTNTILTIPSGHPGQVTNKKLLTQYGMISMQDTRAHVTAYLEPLLGSIRSKQSSHQLHSLLVGSISDETLNRVRTQRESYIVPGVPPDADFKDGVIFLKILLSLVSVQTRTTVTVIRNGLLRDLDTKIIEEFNSDILKLNSHINEQLSELAAYGEAMSDNEMLQILFTAYRKAADAKFVDYIDFTKREWETGKIETLTPNEFMLMGEDFYKTKIMQHEWNVDDGKASQAEQIIALTAAYDTLSAAQGAGTTTKKDQTTQDAKRKKWAWKEVAPSGGQPKSKKFDGKEYIYCPNHNRTKWVLKDGHKDGCTSAPAKPEPSPSPTKKPPAAKPTEDNRKRLLYAKALVAAFQEGNDSGDEGGETEDENL